MHSMYYTIPTILHVYANIKWQTIHKSSDPNSTAYVTCKNLYFFKRNKRYLQPNNRLYLRDNKLLTLKTIKTKQKWNETTRDHSLLKLHCMLIFWSKQLFETSNTANHTKLIWNIFAEQNCTNDVMKYACIARIYWGIPLIGLGFIRITLCDIECFENNEIAYILWWYSLYILANLNKLSNSSKIC